MPGFLFLVFSFYQHELNLLTRLFDSSERFTKVLLEQQQDRAKREQERIRLLTADPFDLDAQAKIEEDIRYLL